MLVVPAVLPVVPLIEGKTKVAGLEGGTLQRLFALATLVPVGVVGFFSFGADGGDWLSPQAASSRNHALVPHKSPQPPAHGQPAAPAQTQ